MVSTSASGFTECSSYVTVALLSIRLTFASVTPGLPARADCTRLWHAAQCIPVTGIVIFVAISVVHDEFRMKHRHPAADVERAGGVRREFDGCPLERGEVATDVEGADDDFFGAARRLLTIEDQANWDCALHSND